MENRMRIVECCSAPLLNCLKEALPYHAEPSLIKRYLKIVANLAYSIRETDSAKLRMNNEDVDLRETSSVASSKQVFTRGSFFLEKYLVILNDIVNSETRRNLQASPSYFSVNNIHERKDVFLEDHESISMLKSHIVSDEKFEDGNLKIWIKMCYRITNYDPYFQLAAIIRLKELELFVVFRSSISEKTPSNRKCYFIKNDNRYDYSHYNSHEDRDL